MKRTTSLAAAVTAAAVIVTPVAGTAAAATSIAPAAVVAPQAITLPSVESFAPDPLKVLALPFSNFDVARKSLFVVTGYVNKTDGKPVRGQGQDPENPDETAAEYSAWLKANAKPVEVFITQAISDSVNNHALKGDFTTALVKIQSYLNQLATQVVGLPKALLDLNLAAFFPPAAPSLLAKTTAGPQAASPFALPDVGALLNVAAIPFKNFDQARLATFVTTGYEKDKAGNLVGKDGKPLLTESAYEAANPGKDYDAYVAANRVPITTNIYTALNAAVNVALTGNFGGAATMVQSYLTEFTGNVVALPREIIAHDLKTLNAVIPSIPTLPEAASSSAAAPQAVAPAGRSAVARSTGAEEATSTTESSSSASGTGAPSTAPSAAGAPAPSTSGPSVRINIFGLDLSPKPAEKATAPETSTSDTSDEGAAADGANDGE